MFHNHRKILTGGRPCARLGLVSLFNDISTLVDYLMPNPSLHKNGSDTV